MGEVVTFVGEDIQNQCRTKKFLSVVTAITIPRELSKIDEKIMNGSDNEPFGNGELRYRIVRGQKGVKLRINM